MKPFSLGLSYYSPPTACGHFLTRNQANGDLTIPDVPVDGEGHVRPDRTVGGYWRPHRPDTICLTVPRKDVITQNQFDELLAWLDPGDRGRDGERYEFIRHSLIRQFVWSGLRNAEDLADETINRVARKLKKLRDSYEGDPALYFHGVAKKLILEVRNSERKHPSVPLDSLDFTPIAPYEDESEDEIYAEALKRCLSNLPTEDRDLLMLYYGVPKKHELVARKAIAEKLNVSWNALRVRVHRIKAKLKKSIKSEVARLREDYGDSPPV